MTRDSKCIKIFKIQMKRRSFTLTFEEERKVAMHKEENSSMLWHKRLRHFHHEALIHMKKKNKLVEGLLELEKELPTCISCQYGKQTRLPFKKAKLGEQHTNYSWFIRMLEDLKVYNH